VTGKDRVKLLREGLESALATERVDIIDDSAVHAGHAGNTGGGHFTVTIVSDRFRDKNTIERHRMVYAAVDHLIPAEIHALSIRALTREET